MCGIAGAYALKKNSENFFRRVEDTGHALAQIAHRGPDHSAVANLDRCVLGHNRLKILDLTAQANQPMSDASGRYTLVFNGEIFNYREIKKSLEDLGVSFQTASDTEVLLQLLIHQGAQALHRLNGFFAFAFYDAQSESLILARDRYGEKPLWYFQNDKELFFCSELKGLRCYEPPCEIDIVSLTLFLQFSYIPAPHSIYKNIFKLEPGHCIVASNEAFKMFQWDKKIPESFEPKKPELVELEFRSILQDAVAIRMQADVNIGCFLSGGIDSSIIALLASQQTKQLKTFSVSFEDQPFLDETKYAEEVAQHLGSAHEVIPIYRKNLIDEMEIVWNHLDEPFSDSSSIAVSLLSSHVKKSVTVALSGDGADEIFGGYNKHLAIWRSIHSNMSNAILPYFMPIIDILPESRNSKIGNKFRQLKRFAHGLDGSIKDRYVLWASWANEKLCEELVTQEVSVRKGARINSFVQDIVADNFNSVLYADQKLVLSNDMLTKVDSMSMLHALEVRPPFLDFRVVEFVNALPDRYKVNKRHGKILLRDIYQKELPASVFNRPKKGFEVPLENWLRNELRDAAYQLLSPEKLKSSDFLNKQIVQKTLDQFYKKGRSEHASLIYSMMVFEFWFRNHHCNSETRVKTK
jgi:asparagine synthase (glutamine-hydrolysing)